MNNSWIAPWEVVEKMYDAGAAIVLDTVSTDIFDTPHNREIVAMDSSENVLMRVKIYCGEESFDARPNMARAEFSEISQNHRTEKKWFTDTDIVMSVR